MTVGCGGEDGSDTRDADHQAGRASARAPTKRHARQRFDVKSAAVKVMVVSERQSGGQYVVHFVGQGPPRSHLQQAQQCVAYFLRSAKAVYCFAFPSEAAFEAARVNPKTGGMRGLCWSARAAQPLVGRAKAELGDADPDLKKCAGTALR